MTRLNQKTLAGRLHMRNGMTMALTSLLLTSGVAWAQTGATDPATAGVFSLSAEALLWWQKASPTPTPIITDGLYGQPGTNVLLGGGDQDTNPNPGLRITAGYTLNDRWGLEGNFLYFGERSTSASVESSGEHGSTDLLLPFFDVTENRENVTEISFSPVYRGSAREEFSNRLMGAEADATYALPSQGPWAVGLIGGFRWLQLKETYAITTSSPYNPPQPEDIWQTNDTFDTSNNFYGAQIGARARYDQDRWSVGGVFKLGLGAMVQEVNINGSLVTNDFTDLGPTQTFPGGYFALPSNIGSESRSVFAVVPEVQLSIGYRITPSATIFAGYNFLYANTVVRPGDQINRNINPTQSVSYTEEPPANLEGTAQPSASFNRSSFWTQGISLGLSVQF